MKKIIVLVLFFLILNALYAEIKIKFLYKGEYYTTSLISNKETEIEPFDALKVVDQSQKHRFLVTSLEKSRLSSLFYLGDRYEFNSVALELVHVDVYKIHDLENNFSLKFSIGQHENIILYSIVKFFNNDDVINKISNALAVKILLQKISGRFEIEKKRDLYTKGVNKEVIEKEFKKFINELKEKRGDEILYFLSRYAELNFELDINENKITEKFINPADVYFFKKGDYKSIVFFYYYVLKEVGYPARLYLVSPLIKKTKEEINELYELFNNRRKPEYRNKIEVLELNYKRVNSKKVLKNFTDSYIQSNRRKPPDIFFFYPPNFEKATLLACVKIGQTWSYTTSIKWVKTDILDPDWVCYSYSKGNCYYAEIDCTLLETIILNNLPFTEEDLDIIWDIYF